jgi:hypothetical protein
MASLKIDADEVETHFHYISYSTRQTTPSGNKVEINRKNISALFPLRVAPAEL